VVALAESYLAGNVGSGNGGERFAVMVHVDQDPLAPDGVLAGSLDDGTRVSAETLRRVACDCGLIAVSGDGEKLNIGHRSRSIPPAIRRALQRPRVEPAGFAGSATSREGLGTLTGFPSQSTTVAPSPAAPTTDSCTATTSGTGCTGALLASTTCACSARSTTI
jgi:hypothetical protein